VITARELFEKWEAAVSPGKQSELEFRSFPPFTATVCDVDKENRSCMTTVDQMASEMRIAEEAAESGKNSLPHCKRRCCSIQPAWNDL